MADRIELDVKMACYLHLHHCSGCDDPSARCWQPDCPDDDDSLEVWRCEACQQAQKEWEESL